MRSLLTSAVLSGTLLSSAHPVLAQLHSPQVTLHRSEKPEDLSWLWTYASPALGADENKLALDPRFVPFLKRYLTAPQSFWGAGRPLAEAATSFLSGPPGAVINDENRYLSADSCVQHFCPNRGLLWVDLGLPHPLVVFAAIDWISENKTVDQPDAAYTLWVFSNRPLALDHLPPALRRSVARWTATPPSAGEPLENITRVFVVDPDGTPHAITPDTLGAHNTLPAETSAQMKVQR